VLLLPRAGEFLEALRECLEERPDACIIAGADLAHLGPRFGDPHEVGTEVAAWCEERDRDTLESAASVDASGFFLKIADERDRRRICGLSAIYTLLETLPRGARGTLLHYGQALDEKRTNFVSFASMAFTTSG
jgi:AmmeMemoRadiSam system protein B